MNELVKALKNFIVRDIIYIIGGVSVILSFLYLFNRIDIIVKETHTAIYLFIAGIAYVIGYCLQDTFSLFGIVTTASYFKPCRLQKWLYKRLERKDNWKDIPKFDPIEADIKIDYAKDYPDSKAFRERITALMQIGTTMGPCGIVSGLLLVIKAFINTKCHFSFNITLAGVVSIISLLLILVGWIKAIQLMEYTYHLSLNINTRNERKV